MKQKYIVTVPYTLECESISDGKKQVETIMEMVGIKNCKIEHVKDDRSLSQNRAMHKWFDLVADEAQEKGLTIDMLILEPTEFPITKTIIKDFFREIGRVLFKRDSTAQLKKDELQKVIEVCEREFAKRLDCTIPFPSEQGMIDNYYQ